MAGRICPDFACFIGSPSYVTMSDHDEAQLSYLVEFWSSFAGCVAIALLIVAVHLAAARYFAKFILPAFITTLYAALLLWTGRFALLWGPSFLEMPGWFYAAIDTKGATAGNDVDPPHPSYTHSTALTSVWLGDTGKYLLYWWLFGVVSDGVSWLLLQPDLTIRDVLRAARAAFVFALVFAIVTVLGYLLQALGLAYKWRVAIDGVFLAGPILLLHWRLLTRPMRKHRPAAKLWAAYQLVWRSASLLYLMGVGGPGYFLWVKGVRTGGLGIALACTLWWDSRVLRARYMQLVEEGKSRPLPRARTMSREFDQGFSRWSRLEQGTPISQFDAVIMEEGQAGARSPGHGRAGSAKVPAYRVSAMEPEAGGGSQADSTLSTPLLAAELSSEGNSPSLAPLQLSAGSAPPGWLDKEWDLVFRLKQLCPTDRRAHVRAHSRNWLEQGKSRTAQSNYGTIPGAKPSLSSAGSPSFMPRPAPLAELEPLARVPMDLTGSHLLPGSTKSVPTQHATVLQRTTADRKLLVAEKTLALSGAADQVVTTRAQVCAQLNRFPHPHVVNVLGMQAVPPRVIIYMNWLPGENLRVQRQSWHDTVLSTSASHTSASTGAPRYLLEYHPLSRLAQLRLCMHLALAVEHVHYHRIVHGDIKSANCMIYSPPDKTEWSLTLFDFEDAFIDDAVGAADGSNASASAAAARGASGQRGTPGWLAPELIDGHDKSPASDVYALGVTMWEIVTGHDPRLGTRDERQVYSRLKSGRKLPLPDDLMPDMKLILLDTWHDDPKKRPSASVVATRLAKLCWKEAQPEQAAAAAASAAHRS